MIYKRVIDRFTHLDLLLQTLLREGGGMAGPLVRHIHAITSHTFFGPYAF